MIAKRVFEISYNEDEFKKAIPLNNKALKNSGYVSSFTFQQKQPKRKSRVRKKNMVWFNSPYSDSIKTNIGKEFFRLLSKHFPNHHKLQKICNKKCVKLSCNCMPNIATIISSHNKEFLRKKTTESNPLLFNCRDKSNCPLDCRCWEKSLVYKATVHVSNSNAMMHYGLCETKFESCYYNHLQSFKHRHKARDTELSKYI